MKCKIMHDMSQFLTNNSNVGISKGTPGDWVAGDFVQERYTTVHYR